jgi:pilus assembly protein Flp/PilA
LAEKKGALNYKKRASLRCNAGTRWSFATGGIEGSSNLIDRRGASRFGDRCGKSEDSMKSFALKVQRFLTSEDGPTAVEYAVMLALIIVVCLTAITAIGTNANLTFNSVAQAIGT